jgi:hypothetical protein
VGDRTLTGLVIGSLAVTLLVVGFAGAFAADHLSAKVSKSDRSSFSLFAHVSGRAFSVV